MCGNYIVIEGIEGAGKSTALGIVADVLHKFGIQKIISVREPGGTQLAENLRNLVLNTEMQDEEIIDIGAEMLIFYAARVQLVETVIKPALAKNNWVIGDRHDLSTQAYQGGGRGISYSKIETLRKLVLGDFQPHLTLYLDITPEISINRTLYRKKIDRIERESFDFLNRVRLRYLELAKQDKSIYVIDATRSLNEVSRMIYTILIQWLLTR